MPNKSKALLFLILVLFCIHYINHSNFLAQASGEINWVVRIIVALVAAIGIILFAFFNKLKDK